MWWSHKLSIITLNKGKDIYCLRVWFYTNLYNVYCTALTRYEQQYSTMLPVYNLNCLYKGTTYDSLPFSSSCKAHQENFGMLPLILAHLRYHLLLWTKYQMKDDQPEWLLSRQKVLIIVAEWQRFATLKVPNWQKACSDIYSHSRFPEAFLLVNEEINMRWIASSRSRKRWLISGQVQDRLVCLFQNWIKQVGI